MTGSALRALLRHPSESCVLVVRSDRAWRLPRAVVGDPARHASTDAVVGAFERRLGTPLWLIRRVADVERAETEEGEGEEEVIFELELLDRDWTPPGHARWIGRNELRLLSRDDPHREALYDYLVALERDETPTRRPPWARAGWQRDVRSWLDREVDRLGHRVLSVEQVKHWSISSVLRVRTDGPVLFLKAPARLPLFAEEGAFTLRLARRFPGYAPLPLAVEPEQGWLLLEAFSELLDGGESLETRAEVFRRFAGLQRQTVSLSDELLADGCIDRRLDVLARQIVELVSAPDATRRLADEEVAELRASTPKLVELCGRLDACGLPQTLVHGDLYPGNVALVDGVVTYYDWTDACIAHPFMDLQSLAWERDEGTRCELLDAYLEPWRDVVVDERLAEAVALAAAVIPLHHAVSYWQIAANLERQAMPELDATHTFLRQALARARAL